MRTQEITIHCLSFVCCLTTKSKLSISLTLIIRLILSGHRPNSIPNHTIYLIDQQQRYIKPTRKSHLTFSLDITRTRTLSLKKFPTEPACWC